MSGMAGAAGSGEDRDGLAAEYVLGTLSALEAARVADALSTDAVLAAAVLDWERRLGPLSRLALPEAPPADLWARIEHRIAPAPADRQVVPHGASGGSRLLRWWAAGATVAAMAMAALLVFPAPSGPSALATAMVGDRTQPAWTASAGSDGVLRLAAVVPAGGAVPPPLPPGRVLQLWALPPGATAPTSLAVLAPGQRSLVLANPAIRPVPGMLIELTVEPAGGSPLARPSGPVQFIGRLVEAPA